MKTRLALPLMLCALLPGLAVSPARGAPSRESAERLARSEAWTRAEVAAIGKVRGGASALESAGNVLSLYYAGGGDLTFRVGLVAPYGVTDGADHFTRGEVRVYLLLDEGPGGETELPPPLKGPAPFAWERAVRLDPPGRGPGGAPGAVRAGRGPWNPVTAERAAAHLERGWLAVSLERMPGGEPLQAAVITATGARELDRLVAPLGAQAPSGETNVAFVHHGNQGLAYSDVFKGRYGAESSSGFDEVLRIHQDRGIPGNFHLGALLQSAAQWDRNNGDPVDFNQWLRDGVTQGWAGMLASAYAQPITPFLQGSMNAWAVDRHVAMTSWRYGYTPNVAWVPERVWLRPGYYPEQGVISWSLDTWQNAGVDAVILDDWPHGQGHDNHRIHFHGKRDPGDPGEPVTRLVLRDGDFTGKLHTGDGAGALQILTDLANSGVGRYRIVVFADDWEQTAEVAGWENTYPFALETYQWMLDKCQTESAWLHTWKLDPALANADFFGDTFYPVNGTYGGIGDAAGYGGNNNAWYPDWAGYVPYANGGDGTGGCAGTGGNCKNHGQLWNDAHYALQNAPDNSIREAGWYVLMTNLHETAWHDYLGGPISGWQLNYSGHIKNAGIYAEAARWAGGQYANPTGAYFSDIDNDGYDELVMYNDRVLAVFESIGGRCTHLFAKGSGYDYSVVGVDNAYWYGTQADYNDGNHVAALSDVGPNYQNDYYAMQVDAASGSMVQATFSRAGVTKTVKLTLGQPYLDCIYRVGGTTQYIQSGWSPDLVDLVYNARLDRIWVPSRDYMGQRNPNTGATGAYVLGSGGAGFQKEIGGTLMKGDEIFGTQKFQFYVYAGHTSPPDGGGNVAELAALAAGLTDQLAPEALSGTYFPVTRELILTFDEPVRYDEIVATGIALDDDDDGVAEVTLDGATTVVNTADAAVITLAVSPAAHAAIEALDHNQMRLLLAAGAVKDVPGNPCAQLTNAGDVFVSYGPPTLLTLDGRFDPSEWPNCAIAVADSFDSQWNAGPGDYTNEIQAVYATWDSTYLYLGIRGVVTGNSWLLYLDTDPGGPDGETDLRAIDTWERGVQLTAPGFRADWQFGAYQHQGVYDSQSFFKITSATTTEDSTAAILKAFDPQHAFGLQGGSELAIPWSTLYGLGPGQVPAGAQLGLVATLCWDPEPSGEAGGDQAPNNLTAVPPVLDDRVVIVLDGDGDGRPDPIDRTPPELVAASVAGTDTTVLLAFSEPVLAATAGQPARYSVYRTDNPAVSLTVKAAAVQADASTVLLTVSSMSNVDYTVVASGISDTTCFRNTANQTTVGFTGQAIAVDPAAPAATVLALAAPFPNPSARGAVLEYAVPVAGAGGPRPLSLVLYDLGGRQVRTLVRQAAAAPGTFRVRFDGRDEAGAKVGAGIYFARLSWGRETAVRRLVVLP